MSENGHAADNMPQTIGRYQVAEGVGFGAMGAVYKAFDPLIKRTLAIKTIRLDIPRQSPQYKSFIDRFYHEARISGTLSHPNIVTLFDIGEENGLPYLAMEFVEGETIASMVERGVRFKPEKVINLVSQVASAIDYAHSKGVIHRDIKPSNLILSDGERVKVTDFGIAKLIDAEMTQSGTLLGTPSYMSPEQAMGEKLDGRSDIFSLGVCAFEMLAGEQPFPGNNVTSILYKLVHVEPIQPANLEMNGLVPQKWHEVFGKVLAKKPDERYQTATEFVQDLEYCLGSWFGSVADMTLAEGVPEIAPGARVPGRETPVASTDATTVMPILSDEQPIEVTVAMTAPDVDKRRAAAEAAPLATMVDAAPAGVDTEGTVVMPTPAVLAGEGTVVMPSPVPPSPLAGEGTVVMASPVMAPAPRPAADMEGTVVMESPVRAATPAAPAPATDADGTLVMPSPVSSAAEGTVVMQAPLTPPAESTVMMSAAPAPRPPAPPVPPPLAPAPPPPSLAPAPPPVGAMEGTVVMSAPVMPPRAPEGRAALAPFADDPATIVTPSDARPGPPGKSGPIPMPPKPTATAAMPPIEPPRKRSAAPLAIAGGGVGLLLLIALAGAAVWYVKSRQADPQTVATPAPPSVTQAVATATPPPPAPTVKGTLHVETEPAGATVILNGEERGVTPLDVADLFLGNHEVKVELKGYASVTQTVVLSEDSPTSELKIPPLSRSAPAMGVAEVISTPSGALVKIDGTGVGETPLLNYSLRAGKHQVEVVKEGYEPWTSPLTVGRRKARVDAQLRPVARATPPPVVADVPDPNKTYEQGDVDTPPRQVTSSSASYPKDAPKLRSGQSVSVGGSFVVTANGDVAEIQIRESGGRAVDDAVMAALAKRKYAPGVKKGVKVRVRVPFRQTFQAS
jgi:TonB family protein